MDDELKYYQTKPLTDDFTFLFWDGITQKVRGIGVEKKVMLCVLTHWEGENQAYNIGTGMECIRF